jgi:tRNA(fMet)-specific endonuclease VapC
MKLASLPANQIACISAITEAELRYGVARSQKSSSLEPVLEWLLAKLSVMPWGREAASAYGPLRAKQETSGKSLGNLDLLIAAHAISVGATLITSDKAFSNLGHYLKLQNWATDLN